MNKHTVYSSLALFIGILRAVYADSAAYPQPPGVALDVARKDPACPYPDPLNYTVHLPHESDCCLFYKCDNGEKKLFECPYTLYFNSRAQVCDWPRSANCPYDTCSVTANPNEPNPITPPPPPPADGKCPVPDPQTYTVHFPHETNCNQFYKCNRGNKVLFSCPSGLDFNRVYQVCDWPRSAGCQLR